MSTLQTIQKMMVKKFDLKEETLTPEAQLESFGLDSLSIIEFMFDIEDAFHIKLPDDRVEVMTILDIAGIVERLVAEQTVAS